MRKRSIRIQSLVIAIIFLLTSIFGITSVSSAGIIDVAPYLYDLQSDSVIVMAVTSASNDTLSVTLKDANGNVLNTFTDNNGTLNSMNQYGDTNRLRYNYSVTLTGLSPNTVYKYDAVICGTTYSDNTFTSAPETGSSAAYKFAVWGDTQLKPLNSKVAPLLTALNPRYLLHVGDLFDEGNRPNEAVEYLFKPVESLLMKSALLPIAGNHDAGALYMNELFPIPRSNTSSQAGNMYYTYDIGNVHYVVIHMWKSQWHDGSYRIYDNNTDPVNGDVARVKRMLEEDAASPAAAAAKWRIVAIHNPPDAPSAPASTKAAWNDLLPYLKKYDPSIVFFGHTHKFSNTRSVIVDSIDSEIKAMTTGLTFSADYATVPSGNTPSYVEGFMNEIDGTTGKKTIRLKPYVWDGNTSINNGSFSVMPAETVINPPVILSTPSVSVTNTSATITWNTDVAADHRVDYGIDRKLTSTSIIQTDSPSTSHSVTLSGLQPDTIYCYRVKGKGANGDIGRTDILTFRTTGGSGNTRTFRQGENGYTGALDTRVKDTSPINNYGGYSYMRLQNAVNRNIGFMKFNNLTDTGNVPAGSTVTSASLKLYVPNVTATYNENIELYGLNGTLGDSNYGTMSSAGSQTGSTCWNYIAYNTTTWGGGSTNGPVSGLDYNSTPFTTFTIPPSSMGTYVDIPLPASVVQNWINNSANNKGIMLKTTVGTTDTFYDFASAEASTLTQRPQLIINYADPVIPTPEPPTPTLEPSTPTPPPGDDNLALGKTAMASSVETTYTANLAVDGNASTRWSSLFSDPQWIYVDLGGTYNVNRVILNWEVAYGSSYQIQVSSNATDWTDVYSTTTGDGGIDDRSFAASDARYVKINGTHRATGYGYSLWEFEVYGNEVAPTPDPSPMPESTSISLQYGSYGYTGAKDADAVNVSLPWYGRGGSDLMQLASGEYSLLYFDVGQIPSNATITDARLTLTYFESYTQNGSSCNIYKITDPDAKGMWTESATTAKEDCQGVCYSARNAAGASNPVTRWTNNTSSTLADSMNTTASSTIMFDSGSSEKTTTSGNLASDVQNWVSGTSTNCGWAISGSGLSARIWAICSKENTAAAKRPVLTISYSIQPTPSLPPTASPTPEPSPIPESTSVSLQYGSSGYTGSKDADAVNVSLPWYGRGGSDYLQLASGEYNLLYFDLAGQIPSNAIITDARLTLTYNESYTQNGSSCNIYKITDTDAKGMWTESTTTVKEDCQGVCYSARNAAGASNPVTRWTNNTSSTLADSMNTTASSTIVFDNGSSEKTTTSGNLAVDVQNWVNGTSPNCGWAISGSGLTARIWGIYSKENTAASKHPKLIITYYLG